MDDVSFPGWPPEKSIHLVTGERTIQVFVKGRLYMSWLSGDEECLRLAIVQLHRCGLGTKEELAAAFGRHINSVQRYLAEFADQGMRGLLSERSGPKGPWKITAAVRAKILLIVLREGVWELEAIQRRLAELWHEVLSVPSIQQVLEENGLWQSPAQSAEGGAVQNELFDFGSQQQLPLNLDRPIGAPAQDSDRLPAQEKETVMNAGRAPGDRLGEATVGSKARRSYSGAQRVYLDQLEQGAYNAYAGGLLFAPLLARYDFLPILRKVITIPTYEGYSLEELSLTLFYLDVFGFRSIPRSLGCWWAGLRVRACSRCGDFCTKSGN